MQFMNAFNDDIESNRYSWKIMEGCNFKNCSHIFPTQQRDVQNLLKCWEKDKNVDKVIIFGSSVTSACNPWSDIDVFVQVKHPVDKFNKPDCVVPFDIWTNFDVDDRLLAEILKTGVVVYEQ